MAIHCRRVVEGRNYMMDNIGSRMIDTARPPGSAVAGYPRGFKRPVSRPVRVSARSVARPTVESAAAETWINISSHEDIVEARRTGSLLVQKMGFSGSRITLVTTVISELARNILLYARAGEIVLSPLDGSAQLNVRASDRGPGIHNLPMVLSGGYSTSGGLGLGLSGLRRIVDEFDIKTQVGKGTQVFVSIHA